VPERECPEDQGARRLVASADSALPANRLRVRIVIPARNEAASIGTVVQAARAVADVMVVDDASSDDTHKLALAGGAEVLRLAVRLGAWGATQAGLRFALHEGADIVVTLDADGQHEPAHVEELIAPIRAGEADVVIGSCPVRVSALRRIAWLYFRLLTGLQVQDITSGFRAYNRRALEILASREATLLDYQDIGVLIILRTAGMRLLEVPVAIAPRRDGGSRIFSSWWVVFRYMVESTVLCIANVGRRPAARSGSTEPGEIQP
jgi:glycosyltransferase involved in cell wall biosynthesis